jgi:hypothetical protein
MLSHNGVDIEGNIMTLMSVDDEVAWQQGGLFTKVDSLGGAPLSLLSCALDSTPAPGNTVIQLPDPSSSLYICSPCSYEPYTTYERAEVCT